MNRQAVPLEKIIQNLKIQAMKPPAEAAAAVITMMRRAGAQVMRDPVVAGDGFTYERDALERWLAARGAVSPVTGAPLPHPNITPNQASTRAHKATRCAHAAAVHSVCKPPGCAR